MEWDDVGPSNEDTPPVGVDVDATIAAVREVIVRTKSGTGRFVVTWRAGATVRYQHVAEKSKKRWLPSFCTSSSGCQVAEIVSRLDGKLRMRM